MYWRMVQRKTGLDRRANELKEELFSSSDRWHQEKVEDFCGRLYSSEDRYKIEQGGGRSSVFTGSKDRACNRERVEKIMGRGKGGTILVHIGTNNADKEGTTTIVDKYRKLLKKTKEARVEQTILSGILPVFGNRIDGYRNSKRMAINGMVKRLCKEDVGYVDLWDSVVGKEGMYARDGLHLSGKGAAVFAEGLSGAVASGLGKVRYLN